MSDLASKYAEIIADDLFRCGVDQTKFADRLLFEMRGRSTGTGWSKTAVQYRLREHLRRMLSDHDEWINFVKE